MIMNYGEIEIVQFTIDKLDDVIHFENNLRKEEDVWDGILMIDISPQ